MLAPMEKVIEKSGVKSLGDMPTLQPLTKKQVEGMLRADLARLGSLLDILYRDQDVFDALADGALRKYENLRQRQDLEKNGDLFKKGVDEQSE